MVGCLATVIRACLGPFVCLTGGEHGAFNGKV